MEKTTLTLPQDLLAAYAALSRRQRRPAQDVMREALQAYIDAIDSELPSWVGKLDDPDITSENFDDWLKANWTAE